jgi:hypothetical protein
LQRFCCFRYYKFKAGSFLLQILQEKIKINRILSKQNELYWQFANKARDREWFFENFKRAGRALVFCKVKAPFRCIKCKI